MWTPEMKTNTTALLAILITGTPIQAKPVTLEQAKAALTGWLKLSPSPLNEKLTPERVQVKASGVAPTLYYVATLEPEGFVVLSADDELEPIVAFGSNGSFVETAENPLFNLIQSNLTAQIKQLTNPHPSFRPMLEFRAKTSIEKWNQLIQSESLESEGLAETPKATHDKLDDPRVDPLVKSQWGQKTVQGQAVFNRFTPQQTACGSSATALAQLMRFHKWPVQAIGDLQSWITVNGRIQMAKFRGGDGQGGAYNFEQMPLSPYEGLREEQLQALGTLTYDAGISLNMSYTQKGGFTDASRTARALKQTFKFGQAILDNRMGRSFKMAQDFFANLGSNLDAGLPTLMAIGPNTGQCVICDGYGYQMNTLYHHLNLGWSASPNAWYKLPEMDTGNLALDVIQSITYNIFPQGTGECVSGRVLDDQGKPLEGVAVNLGDNLSQTNDRGIFAFSRIASGRYVLEASKPGYTFVPQQVRVGISSGSTSGNLWGLSLLGTYRGEVSQRFVAPKKHHAQRKAAAH